MTSNEDIAAKTLGQQLAASYRIVVHAEQHSLEQVNEQLQLLVNYGGRLPLTWFTSSLQEALLSLSKEALTFKRPLLDANTLALALQLWSFWIRRLGEFHNSPYLEVVIERALNILQVASDEPQLNAVLEPCTITLAVAVGKINEEMEKSVTSALLAWIIDARRKHKGLDFIYPCVAHIMQTARRNSTIRDTSAVFLQSWSPLGAVVSDEPLIEDCQQIYRLYQHILDHRTSSSSNGHSTVTKKNSNSSEVVTLSSESRRRIEQRIDALLASFDDVFTASNISVNTCILLAAAGILRSPVTPLLGKERCMALEVQVWHRIQQIIDMNISLKESNALAFTCGHCLPVMDLSKCCKESDVKTIEMLLNGLLSFLLDNPHTLAYEFLLSLSIGLQRDSTHIPEAAVNLLKDKTSGIMFGEVGHLSRAIASLLGISNIATIDQCVDRLKIFAHNQLLAWANCAALVPLETEKSTIDMIWQHFKFSLFAFTLIMGAITKHSSVSVEHLMSLLSTAQYLHFITLKVGSFSAYQSMLVTIVKSLRKSPDTLAYAIRQIHPKVSEQTVESNDTKRACLLFYFDLIEQNVDIIPDIQLAEEILPLTQPYLNSKSYQDAFESAHSVLLSVFLKKKLLATQLGPYYANWLLESYPSLLSIDQLRRVYTAMVDCLADQDSALAWLTVQRLIDAIDALSPIDPVKSAIDINNNEDAAELATAITRGHLLVTLFDQLPTVPLVQLDHLMERVRHYLLAEQPSLARSALVKILFDNVSRSLDFSRKERATKWYLSLVDELGQSGVSL
ncbi:hypothetical protein BDF19DRAFT_419330 [Syncephalis fuscata]|nr:hypothetical protein BDF19DRAFT_419330 [Syncephalis fuscata]